jgi:hypothetical protein
VQYRIEMRAGYRKIFANILFLFFLKTIAHQDLTIPGDCKLIDYLASNLGFLAPGERFVLFRGRNGIFPVLGVLRYFRFVAEVHCAKIFCYRKHKTGQVFRLPNFAGSDLRQDNHHGFLRKILAHIPADTSAPQDGAYSSSKTKVKFLLRLTITAEDSPNEIRSALCASDPNRVHFGPVLKIR